MSSLLILIGPPGSGKTHFAVLLTKTAGYFHLNSDQTRMKYFQNPVFTAEERANVYLKMREIAEKKISEGESVIYDGNLITNEDRWNEFNYFKNKANVKFLVFNTDKELALARAVTRKKSEDKLYKPMDEARAKAMHNNFQVLDYDLPHVVINSNQSFEEQMHELDI